MQKPKNNDFALEGTAKWKFDDGSNIYFTSDTHFNHDNIIRFCDRPFKSVQEMDEELIRRWNSVVGPDDIVFHLGDFAWGGSQVWNSVLDRLNGHIYLVLGNHDIKNLRQGYISKFEWVGYQMQITIEGRSVYLNHVPFLTVPGVYRSADQQVWQLFGHVHSTPDSYHKHEGSDKSRLKYLFPCQYDVGVDNNDYTPVPWNKVKDIINKQIEVAEFNSKPWYLRMWIKLKSKFDKV